MLNPMDTAVLLFETRASRLTTPDGAWQFGADYGLARESKSHSSKS
jgi:hypothetical protein